MKVSGALRYFVFTEWSSYDAGGMEVETFDDDNLLKEWLLSNPVEEGEIRFVIEGTRLEVFAEETTITTRIGLRPTTK